MKAPPSAPGPAPAVIRPGFTLVELLVTMSIVSILAGMLAFAMYQVQQQSRIEKTQALIARLDNIIMARWDSFRTRRVPVTIDPAISSTPGGRRLAAQARLSALRELMRLELPDRWADILDSPISSASAPATPPLTPIPLPSVTREYRRRLNLPFNPDVASRTTIDQWIQDHADFQNAECLYLIVMASVPDDASPRDMFSPDEIGDVDGDGLHEFIDAWGTPIRFLRWAPGFHSDLQPQLAITSADFKYPQQYSSADDMFTKINKKKPRDWGNVVDRHDPFDTLKLQPEAFALTPLIYSAGPNKHFNIVSGYKDASDRETFRYSAVNNDPFYIDNTKPQFPIGTPDVLDGDRLDEYLDNIHNHLLGVRQ